MAGASIRLLHLRGDPAGAAAMAAFCERFLVPADQAALAATRSLPRRARRAVSRALIRWLAARDFAIDPDSLDFAWTGAGKPRLSAPALHFSVSYSGADTLVALSSAGPVGVDLELLRPRPRDRLRALVCSAAEAERLGSAPPRAALYRLWTAKEALVKATGEGLAAAMPSITLDALLGPASESAAEHRRAGRRWSVRAWTGGGRALALAHPADPAARVIAETIDSAALT